MGRKFAALGLCLTAGLFTVSGLVMADDKKSDKIDVHEIMEKVPGKKGLCATCAAAAKAGKWEDAQKASAEMKKYGEAMGQNDPPKGSKDSWAKLTKKFAEQMTAIDDAAQKKDAAAVAKATGAFTQSCKACHDAHKSK